MSNTSDLSNQFLKIIIYGRPGTGKTLFGGSTQKRFKTLILSVESGLLSLRNLKDAEGNPLHVDYVPITSFADFETVFRYLQMEKHEYKAVVMDSGTEIQQACMTHILKEENRDKPQMQDWGTLNNKMVRLIRAFRDMPIHFVMTALDEQDKDEQTGEVRVGPMFQGKLADTITAYFDEVFYSYSKQLSGADGKPKVEYSILTNNNGKYVGKDRSGALPLVVTDPSFGSVYDLIFKPKEEPKNESTIQPGRPGGKK